MSFVPGARGAGSCQPVALAISMQNMPLRRERFR